MKKLTLLFLLLSYVSFSQAVVKRGVVKNMPQHEMRVIGDTLIVTSNENLYKVETYGHTTKVKGFLVKGEKGIIKVDISKLINGRHLLIVGINGRWYSHELFVLKGVDTWRCESLTCITNQL